jgi:hypothetical protein
MRFGGEEDTRPLRRDIKSDYYSVFSKAAPLGGRMLWCHALITTDVRNLSGLNAVKIGRAAFPTDLTAGTPYTLDLTQLGWCFENAHLRSIISTSPRERSRIGSNQAR